MSILYTITTINARSQRGVVININSAEIAKMAGVSRSTVSRVINGYSNVPPETREKVEAAIKKYGYTPYHRISFHPKELEPTLFG